MRGPQIRNARAAAALLALGLAVRAGAQSFALDSASLVITEGQAVSGRTAADLRKAVGLNLHLLAFVAAANRQALASGARVMVNLTVGPDGIVTASRMVESSLSDSAANAALVRSMLHWRFVPSPGSTGPVAFSFRLEYGQGAPAVTAAQTAGAVPRSAPKAAEPVPAVVSHEQARAQAAAMATRRPESGLSAYERQRAGTAIGVLGGMSLGTALLATGAFALGAAFESGGNEQVHTACNVIGGCLAGASGVCLASGAAVGIRLSVRARKGTTPVVRPGW